MASRSMFDVGVLRDTLIPSLAFQASAAVPAFALARTISYVEAKDHLWIAGILGNTWWSAVGRRVVYDGVPLSSAIHLLSRPGRLLLTGVTLWGVRLWYREVSRAVRRGEDDVRYKDVKTGPGAWGKILLQLFVPGVIVESIIALPLTGPFRTTYPVLPCPSGMSGWLEALAIASFGAGFAMEVLADWQLDQHQKAEKKTVLRVGVWSIVRHPNYLGDFLMHGSFSLFLYSQSLLNPYLLLGPLAEWYYLRHLGGDLQTEKSMKERYAVNQPEKLVDFKVYQEEKNAFWPSLKEMGNHWTWTVLGCGAGLLMVERGLRAFARQY